MSRKKRQDGRGAARLRSTASMSQVGSVLQQLGELRRRLAGDVSLRSLAARSAWSPFHFHRTFREITGETPKQYAERLRLERAAVRLGMTDDRVLDVALDAGYESHEVFSRAFRRRFGLNPAAFRASVARAAIREAGQPHIDLADATSACAGLFHLPTSQTIRRIAMPTLSIEPTESTPRPVLFVHERTARHELAQAITQGLGKVVMHAQMSGAAFAGKPFTRYLSAGPGLMSVEIGMPIASPVASAGPVFSGTLGGGRVALGIHGGPYDQLGETYAAMERWIEANGYRAAGPAWEIYVTDPADHPNPADWRTEVYWPIEGA